MQISLNIKTLLIASLALFVMACNSNSSKEKDKAVNDTSIAPPPQPTTPPSNVDIKPAEKKCFSSDGLKYSTVISLNITGDNVTGNVTSEELGSGKKESTEFEGIFANDKFAIKFKGTPPVAGDASEWTNKPWTMEQGKGKEKLHIIFNAKNYETNKWSDTDYEFALVDCK